MVGHLCGTNVFGTCNAMGLVLVGNKRFPELLFRSRTLRCHKARGLLARIRWFIKAAI